MRDLDLSRWIALDASTPTLVVSSSGYLTILEAAINTARALADPAKRVLEQQLAAAVQATLERVVTPRPSLYSRGSLALILRHAEMSDHHRDARLAQLTESIQKGGTRFTLGENCLPALVQVLHDSGHDELLYQM